MIHEHNQDGQYDITVRCYLTSWDEFEFILHVGYCTVCGLQEPTHTQASSVVADAMQTRSFMEGDLLSEKPGMKVYVSTDQIVHWRVLSVEKKPTAAKGTH